MPITRRNPRAKTNEWIAQRMEAQQSLPPDVYEGVAVNDRGELIEGFSSNFYAIKDDRLYTVDRGMLRGIAREIVLKISEGILPIDLSAIHMQDIPSLQEAFLTSSSRGILAIIAIDDHLISQGRPGPITSELTNRYDAWVDQHLEPI
jgi:branched-chain amino acid aminotransferase